MWFGLYWTKSHPGGDILVVLGFSLSLFRIITNSDSFLRSWRWWWSWKFESEKVMRKKRWGIATRRCLICHHLMHRRVACWKTPPIGFVPLSLKISRICVILKFILCWFWKDTCRVFFVVFATCEKRYKEECRLTNMCCSS